MELPLPSSPPLSTGPMPDTCGGLAGAERPALPQSVAVHGPAGGRRGRHRWQQMLSSVKTTEAKQNKKNPSNW